MIIFGWNHQIIKQIGVAFKHLCNHCHNEEYWILTRISTWFTLFFIPIFPYEIKYFLSCPICKFGLTLNREQIKEIKPLAEINQLLLDGKITQEEHQVRLNQLANPTQERIEAKTVEAEALTDGKAKLNYCSGCGGKITTELKFCGNCGTQVVSK